MPTDLEARRSLNLRQLLTRSTRAVNELIAANLRERGYAEVRVAHGAVLANLELDGSTVKDVATRAMLPKQTISKLALELEALGYLVRSRHAVDGRATILRFTRKGRRLMTVTFESIVSIESSVQSRLGARRYATLRAALLMLARADGLQS